jgi:hypothetical protein
MTLYDEGAFVTKLPTGEEFRHCPEYGDLIIVDNTSCSILHKAEYTKHRRVIASFDFRVNK